MDPISILSPTHTAAARGAHDLPTGPASGATRPASGSGFAVKSLDKLFGTDNTSLDEVALTGVKVELDFDKSTNRIVATVMDRDTGEVLNQFPAEAILQNARGLRELLDRKLDMKV